MEVNSSRDEFAGSRPSGVKRRQQQHRWCKNNVPKTLRRIRLIQLILDVMLFSLTIYLLTSMSTAVSIILIILFASFAIIMCIDAFGQIGGCLLPDLPMFLVALLGFLLFTSVAAQTAYLVYFVPENAETKTGFILALIVLCLVAAFFFVLDAMTMIMYWQHIYTSNRTCLSCSPGTSTTILYKKSTQHKANEMLEVRQSKSNPIVRDVSTTFSQGRQRSSHSGFLGYRSNNRVGVGPRREYTDCETTTDLETSSKLVETQTQAIKPVENVDDEISAIAVVQERDVQTFPRCPMCSAALDYQLQGICPTFLAMVQGFGMFPCRGSSPVRSEAPVLVDRTTSPGSNSSFKEAESTVVINKKPPRVYETHPCPTHGAGLIALKSGLPSPVTRISLSHCIRKNKRTQTPTTKPIMVMESCQNTEINIVVSSFCRSVATLTEGCCSYQDSFSGQESFEKVGIPSEEKSEVVTTREELTNTESSRRSRDSSSAQQNSEKIEIGNKKSGDPVKVEENTTEIKKENSQELNDSSGREESLKEVKVQSRENISTTNIEDEIVAMKKESLSKEDVLSSKILSGSEGADSVASAPVEVPVPMETAITSAEISRHSNESRESASPVQLCKCSQYYYKDVFGRYICSLCSHKYLIKIPQRYTIKPPGDIKCCSCSQAIFYQASIAGHTRCQRWCRCRCHTHAGSKK